MRCSFCSVRLSFPSFRRAPLAEVGVLLGKLENTTKKIHVNFEDDNLLQDRDHLFSALDMLDSVTSGNYSFSMENGAEFRHLDEDTIVLLKKYRIRQLNLPLVSSNREILTGVGRSADAGAFEKVVESCRAAGIPVTAYLIAGLPGESASSVHGTLDFLERLPVLPAVSIFYPVPGIAGYEDRSVFDKVSPRLCSGMSLYQWNDCTTAELFDIFSRTRKISVSRA